MLHVTSAITQVRIVREFKHAIMLTLASLALVIAVFMRPAFAEGYLESHRNRLAKLYKQGCEQNIAALVNFFRSEKTRVEGHTGLAYTYAGLNCDLQDDPIFQNSTNVKVLAKTDLKLNKMGTQRYIAVTRDSLRKAKAVYKIESLRQKARGQGEISFDDLLVLLSFAKASANSNAFIDILLEE